MADEDAIMVSRRATGDGGQAGAGEMAATTLLLGSRVVGTAERGVEEEGSKEEMVIAVSSGVDILGAELYER